MIRSARSDTGCKTLDRTAIRRFVVDTIATIVFFTTVATFSERVIAGLDWSEVLITRAIMLPVMVLTGRAYGLWRDWLLRGSGARHTVSRTVVDTVAFLLFQIPVYGATLAVAGANLAQTSLAISAAALFMVVLARPFGLFLDLARRVSGTTAPSL